MTKHFLSKIVAAIALIVSAVSAQSETYPTKTISIVVPFPAGGALDIVGRVLAEELRKTMGQAVIVENKPGAGGTVGSSQVASATPDGHTLLIGSVATHAIAAGLYSNLPYDPVRDFAPITQLTSGPLVLALSGQLGAKTVDELIAVAKARPNALNYASTGNGTALHLAGELFKAAAAIDVQHIPYKGGGQAMNAMLAGEVAYIIGNTQLVLPHIRSGKLRGLAVTGSKRLAALPDLPTFAEAGTSGMDVVTWFGLFAPAATPRDVLDRLNADAIKALSTETVRQRFMALGDFPVGTSLDEFSEFVRSEHARWVKAVRAAGVRID